MAPPVLGSDGGEDSGAFDVVLLGLGTDGHTASLFLDSEAVSETRSWVRRNYIPQLGTHRVTLTIPALKQGRRILFLVSGESKARALKQVLEGPRQPSLLAAQTIGHKATWYVDPGAATLCYEGSRHWKIAEEAIL